jgi:hypothetical protein
MLMQEFSIIQPQSYAGLACIDLRGEAFSAFLSLLSLMTKHSLRSVVCIVWVSFPNTSNSRPLLSIYIDCWKQDDSLLSSVERAFLSTLFPEATGHWLFSGSYVDCRPIPSCLILRRKERSSEAGKNFFLFLPQQSLIIPWSPVSLRLVLFGLLSCPTLSGEHPEETQGKGLTSQGKFTSYSRLTC